MTSAIDAATGGDPHVRPRPNPARTAGLDGIRGLAALFVVIHHCFLSSFPGYPRMTGPGWAGWMIFGHLAVVVFIVLSGFSLSLAPALRGWHLTGLGTYAHRRAWRILSAYWPALVFSFAMAWLVVPQPGEGDPTARSALVYGLLVQDVTGAPSPNGAFWSIAIEAQLYVLLPLLLVVVRRGNLAVMLAVVTAPVLCIGLLAPASAIAAMFTRFTPQLAVGFALGVVAAGMATHQRWRRLPLLGLAVAAVLPPLAIITTAGYTWTVEHYFLVDLAVMPAIALFLAAIAAGRAPRASAFLDVPPLRGLGGFSYSLYLVHAPIVVAVAALVVVPWVGHGTRALLLMLVIALPLSVAFARVFAGVFDLPFQHHKSWKSLRAALGRSLHRHHLVPGIATQEGADHGPEASRGGTKSITQS